MKKSEQKHVWIERHSEPDSIGRVHYTLQWLAFYSPGHPGGEYGPKIRGQGFFCNPHDLGHENLRTWNEQKARAAIAKAEGGAA